MPALPTGTVTFLYTDLEGSTARWEARPQAMRAAVARHDALLRDAIAAHHGHVFRAVGDGLCAAFARAPDAVAAALAAQRALLAEPWGDLGALPARMALHTAIADHQDGDYVGAGLNRIGRLLGVGYGEQVLLSGGVHPLVRDALPPGAGLRDLGEHRLRDLVQPERIYQLLHPDLPADFAPLRSLDAFRHNLPLQLTSFVGREAEVAEVRRLLTGARLLTLTGTGGCGKTRLALQVAADLVDAYPDGVWFVDLAPLADPDGAARAAAGVLGVAEQPAQPLLTTLGAALRGRRLLLLLDNCEHLIDAVATLVEALLRDCPGLRVLATSRELLGAAGELAWRVPSLPAPDVAAAPAGLLAFAAARLFVERAQLVQPAFAITDANAGAVAQICRRLDGLPLALELAAARVTALSAEQIAARLDDRFRLLTGGRRTALRRQQTLAAAIDWSHDLLTEPERTLLRRLSVFAGGWTLAAAEAVGAGGSIAADEVLDLLTRLVEKSLVVAEPGAEGEARYRLLETVRQYAGDKLLAAGEAATARDRHLAWAVALTEQAEPALRGREQVAWQVRLEAEHDNIRTALRWAGERGDADAALRLSGNLWHFWEVRGHYVEGRAHYDAALALPGAAAPTAARALALAGAGWLTFQVSDFPAARRRLEAAAALADQVGEPRTAVLALGCLGMAMTLQSDYPTARRYAAAALRHAGSTGDVWAEAFALRCRTFVAGRQGDRAALRRGIDRRRPGVRQLGNPWLEHNLSSDLATLARLDGDPTATRAHWEQFLLLARALASPRSVAAGLLNLAAITLDAGDLTAARRYGAEGLGLMRDLGNRWEVPRGLEGVAGQAAATGRPARALRLAGAAAAIRAGLGTRAHPRERENLDRWLAPARQALGEAEQAAAWACGEALTLEEAVAEALAEEGRRWLSRRPAR